MTAEDEPLRGAASFFSRGVDSMLTAALERSEPLTHLVYCDGLEPIHDRAVAAAEVRRAREAAAAVGVPLAVVHTNVRSLSHELCDWGDSHGGGLAGVALALGVRRVVIPASTNVVSLGPFGSSPLLDGLFSTESVAVQHDDVTLTRAGKVACLAAQRPDLLGHLKVCYEENRSDNCGRCGKCLHTMASLEAVGALGLASQFPRSIDLRHLSKMAISPLQSRLEWEATMRALPAGDLRGAMASALRRSTRRGLAAWRSHVQGWLRGGRPQAHYLWRDPDLGFDSLHHDRIVSVLHYGEPFPPLGDEAEPPVVALRLTERGAHG